MHRLTSESDIKSGLVGCLAVSRKYWLGLRHKRARRGMLTERSFSWNLVRLRFGTVECGLTQAETAGCADRSLYRVAELEFVIDFAPRKPAQW